MDRHLGCSSSESLAWSSRLTRIVARMRPTRARSAINIAVDIAAKVVIAIAISATLVVGSSHLRAQETPAFAARLDFLKLPADVKLGRCSAVATGTDGELYLFHRGPKPILCVNASRQLVRSWGDEEITTAHGMRIDRDGHVWVTDIGRHRVLKFDKQGKLLLALGTGKPGAGPDEFNQPTDVAFSTNGDFYVTDGYGNSRVLKFTAAGRLIKSWGTKGKSVGEFVIPHAIVRDGRGRLLVGDRENDRIQVFTEDGEFLEQWPGFAPYGIVLDSQGRVFVADGRANQVLRLDAQGRVAERWGKKGAGAGEFDLPHMLDFDSHGNLYVAEVGNLRFQQLERKLKSP